MILSNNKEWPKSCLIVSLSLTDICGYMYRYMDQKGSTVMLAIKRTTGNADNEPFKQGIYPGLETQGSCHQKSKIGIPEVPQRRLVSSKKSPKDGFIFLLDLHIYYFNVLDTSGIFPIKDLNTLLTVLSDNRFIKFSCTPNNFERNYINTNQD